MRNRWPRAPKWAWVVIVAGLAAIGALVPVNMSRLAAVPTADVSASAAPSRDAPTATPSVATPSRSRAVRMLVIGDSYTAGSAEGGIGSSGWPQLVHSDLSAAGYDILMDVRAVGGSGYVEPGPSRVTFLQQAQRGGGYDVVVIFGSRNDTAPVTTIRQAATATYRQILASSPRAKLIVIGPPWVNGDPPAGILASRDAVSSAARVAGAVFVDPLTAGWFAGSFQRLIGADGVHPTNEGHRRMADLILRVIRGVLDELTPNSPVQSSGAVSSSSSR